MREKIFTKRNDDIEKEMKRLFSGFAQMRNGSVLRAINVWHPPTDVCETKDEFCIICEIAGVSRDEIRVHIEDDVITISGLRRELKIGQKTVFHNLEINYGPFERNIQIPRNFVGSEPEAHYSDGFLTVRIPATGEAEKTVIDVEVD